jgi:hypothetical protein
MLFENIYHHGMGRIQKFTPDLHICQSEIFMAPSVRKCIGSSTLFIPVMEEVPGHHLVKVVLSSERVFMIYT